MPTTLVISPHLDDAALSIGGAIARWTAAGEHVVVATVYTSGPPLADVAPDMRQFADYDTRRAEDAAACRVLGAELRHLGQTESAFRQPFLTSFDFFRTSERAAFTTLPAVTTAIAGCIAEQPARILVPLGIGNHVDHVETLVAATDAAIAAGVTRRLAFYEDFYALEPSMRMAHSIAQSRAWDRVDPPLARSPKLAAVLQLIAGRRSGPDVTELLAPELRAAHWSVTPVDVHATERTKLAAIACYRSQTRVFGGLLGVARALHAYHLRSGGEPLWVAA